MASILKQLGSLNLDSAGTAQAFSATDIVAESVLLSAPAGNTGVIYIGDADVSATNAAFILVAGGSVVLDMPRISGGNDMTNLKLWYFDGGTTGDDVTVGYIQRTN